MAIIVGLFQVCYQGALVVQILVATRVLGLSEHQVGLCYVSLGVGTIGASAIGNRVAMRLGPGPTLLLGIAICGVGWLALALASPGVLGVVAFVFMLWAFGVGAVLLFINFLALRQSVTPAPLLGRMTTTMRWFVMIPGIPGALAGGWIGEHLGLQATLAVSGLVALLTAAAFSRLSVLRELRVLPVLDRETAGPVGSLIPTLGTD
jgi:predicted MFS family arabinose efflux permease